ncbi:cytochrome P460 family protein [Puia sp.]|jgi:hypothetical protein|uniref:cytochrome P460 family protein n=1 Tax=Puia sp. TaxID=2045100 RepID=UPI002F42C608
MIPARPVWRTVRVLLLICFLLFVAIQFIRPPLDNPPVTADLEAPPPVKAILRRACYDCHSNETRLAWFDQPAPAYWLVVRDVRAGRRVLNFSNFGSLPKGVQAAKLFECIMQVEQQAMPLSQYALLHHGATIDQAAIGVLKEYASAIGYHAKPDTGRERAQAEQYTSWNAANDATNLATNVAIRDEYNGVAYGPLAGFPTWKAVSTTERFDNGTLRLILGNDITIKAIREGHTNPWPDGAVFAKVAWDQLPDSSGAIYAGAYKQVEFMIRDGRKYASTFGWGFARWVGGLAMKPYGKDASFAEECVNCHRPVAAFDHTFTIPLADTLSLYDQAAFLPDSVDRHPLMGKVITTMVDTRGPTMSTLYGNDLALKAARKGQSYYPGAFYALVTWGQRDDPHWFGGRIPKELVKVETVECTTGGEVHRSVYQGMPLKKMPDGSMSAKRAQYITALKASVFP